MGKEITYEGHKYSIGDIYKYIIKFSTIEAGILCRRELCFGCSTDGGMSPSQVDHMHDGGCFLEWNELDEAIYADVFHKIDCSLVNKRIKAMLDYFKIENSDPIVVISLNQVKETLSIETETSEKEKVLFELYENLRDNSGEKPWGWYIFDKWKFMQANETVEGTNRKKKV